MYVCVYLENLRIPYFVSNHRPYMQTCPTSIGFRATMAHFQHRLSVAQSLIGKFCAPVLRYSLDFELLH